MGSDSTWSDAPLDRESRPGVTEAGEGRLQVHGHRVVDAGRDAVVGQSTLPADRLGGAHGVEVVGVAPPVHPLGCGHPGVASSGS